MKQLFKRNPMTIIPFVVFLILSICLWRGLQLDPRHIPSTLVDKPLPAFHLPMLLQPEKMITNTDWKGQVAIINLWASWCESCIHEHALLKQLSKNTSLRIYGINYKDDRDQAKQWLARHGNPYTMIVADEAGQAAIDLGVYGTPETFVIDAKGIIRYKHIGVLNEKVVNQTLLPLIEKLRIAKQEGIADKAVKKPS